MKKTKIALAGLVLAGFQTTAFASSHREAPFISELPKVDGTDFYLFNSYEAGRDGYVTVIANYLGLQDAYGGPNFFSLDPDAVYDINFDNDGDSKPDITFRFDFTLANKDFALTIPPEGGPNAKNVSIPLAQKGQISAGNFGNLNYQETYKIAVLKKNSTRGAKLATNVNGGSSDFLKPFDYIGTKTFPDYATYAASHIHSVNIPGCGIPAKVFVGQRKEGFFVNLGEIFDLINLNPLGSTSGEMNTLNDKNVTSIAMEIHKSCLVSSPSQPIIGGWTTASLPGTRTLNSKPSFLQPERTSGNLVQVSRLGNPLVNEVVIGLKDKNKFNNSQPKDDAQFASYVTNPTLPALIQILFNVPAPTAIPRTDLLAVFITGIEGLNKFGFGEMMRLNTNIPAVAAASQNTLGVIGGDVAGYPNGRRPGDDVVDISLRVLMGKLLPVSVAPVGQAPLTDGVSGSATDFARAFPYLNTPIPGSPN